MLMNQKNMPNISSTPRLPRGFPEPAEYWHFTIDAAQGIDFHCAQAWCTGSMRGLDMNQRPHLSGHWARTRLSDHVLGLKPSA
jgi:hypothetical protein